MDYQRIYTDFIASRKARAGDLTGYSERHHIVPRSFGGGNEPENLVRLTPEDHFFAHLLLAKIHGGKMWSPVAFMVGGSRKDYKPIESRRAYAWVKLALAKSKMREGAHQFDTRIHHLRHKDGREWSGYQIDMADSLGIAKSQACLIINGKQASAKGWYLADRPEPSRSGKNHPGYKDEVFDFCHVDGREFRGTRYEMHVTHGLPNSKVSNLVTGRQRVASGWHLKGVKLHNVGRGAKLGGGCEIGEHGVKEIRLRHVDGRTFTGTRREAIAAYNISAGHLSQMVNGRCKSVKGWKLAA